MQHLPDTMKNLVYTGGTMRMHSTYFILMGEAFSNVHFEKITLIAWRIEPCRHVVAAAGCRGGRHLVTSNTKLASKLVLYTHLAMLS